VQIHTGRTHQVRVHFQFIGHPLVGDAIYGARLNARLKELTSYAAPRVMLHARELSFIHPRTEEQMSFEAPLPKDFREALKLCERTVKWRLRAGMPALIPAFSPRRRGIIRRLV